MSARSIRRAHSRSLARRAALGTATVLGAGAVAAGSAQGANFAVTSTADSGVGSLRSAIASANGLAGPDTVTFSGAGASGTITLLSALPKIVQPLDIQGPGATALTIDAARNDGIFVIGGIAAADQPVTISGLRLVNAFSNDTGGGSILNYDDGANAAELTVSGVTINNSRAKYDGGAISSDGGSLRVVNTTITRSRTDGGYVGGAIYVDDTDGDTPVEVTIANSSLTGNASGHGGGIYIDSPDGAVEISGTTIAENTAVGDGGGLFFDNSGTAATLTISSSTISGNEAFGFGGGLDLDNPRDTVIRNSTVADNSAEFGGGLYLYNGESVPFTIADSTVSGNSAARDGGGIAVYGQLGDELGIQSSIVAGNTAVESGADIAQYVTPGEPITAGNSLIGTISGGSPLDQVPAGTNKLGVAPQLGPLADNGGPTLTMAPALSSPAVDAGVANALTQDQRGLARTVIQPTVPLSAGSDGTDIGAVELAVAPPPSVEGADVKAKKTQKQEGKKVVILVKAGAAEEVTIEAEGSVKYGKKKTALKKLTKQAAAGKRITLKLKPKKKSASKKILGALANGEKAKASISVTLTDAEGADATKKVSVKLK